MRFGEVEERIRGTLFRGGEKLEGCMSNIKKGVRLWVIGSSRVIAAIRDPIFDSGGFREERGRREEEERVLICDLDESSAGAASDRVK